MDYFDTIDLNIRGDVTDTLYLGKFKVKTILSRRDYFTADLKRREIVGPVSPENAMATLVGEAYMLGQLYARIIEAPDWWLAKNSGIDLEDSNVISVLFEKANVLEKKAKESIKAKATDALEKLNKPTESK
jgi:hypothetical protein